MNSYCWPFLVYISPSVLWLIHLPKQTDTPNFFSWKTPPFMGAHVETSCFPKTNKSKPKAHRIVRRTRQDPPPRRRPHFRCESQWFFEKPINAQVAVKHSSHRKIQGPIWLFFWKVVFCVNSLDVIWPVKVLFLTLYFWLSNISRDLQIISNN